MKASVKNPIYTVYIVSGQTKYNLTNAVESIGFSEQKKQIAKSCTIDLVNVKVGGSWLSSLLKVRDRVFIYADDGERSEEVWRGYVWTRSYRSRLDGHNLTLKCYDNLIYWQESEDAEFFASGKSTKEILSTLCSKWGVKLEYSYESITHSKLALRGTMSDIVTSDVLDLVKDRTGKKYVITSEKDVVNIRTIGSNSRVYTIKSGQNAIQTSSECTMEGMTTQVVILGKADKEDRQKVEGTVSGNTGAYGTLQKLITRDENTSLDDTKKEAQSIIDADGKPKWEYEITTVDIPWIRKGDRVKASAGDMTSTYIVVGIDRDLSNSKKQMTLTVENA